jgi:coenzyme PQQ biosynthesis protein PqqD
VISPGARFELHAKARLRHDKISGQTMLLWPERGMTLNASGAEILRLCGEGLTVAEVIDRVAADHGIDHDRASADVVSFLEALVERGLLRAREPSP